MQNCESIEVVHIFINDQLITMYFIFIFDVKFLTILATLEIDPPNTSVMPMLS